MAVVLMDFSLGWKTTVNGKATLAIKKRRKKPAVGQGMSTKFAKSIKQ